MVELLTHRRRQQQKQVLALALVAPASETPPAGDIGIGDGKVGQKAADGIRTLVEYALVLPFAVQQSVDAVPVLGHVLDQELAQGSAIDLHVGQMDADPAVAAVGPGDEPLHIEPAIDGTADFRLRGAKAQAKNGEHVREGHKFQVTGGYFGDPVKLGVDVDDLVAGISQDDAQGQGVVHRLQGRREVRHGGLARVLHGEGSKSKALTNPRFVPFTRHVGVFLTNLTYLV